MKRLRVRMVLGISLWCGAASSAADRPSTIPLATTTPATQPESDAIEMIPPASHWPGVVVGAAGGLFVLAAVIGPLVLLQAKRKAAYSQRPSNLVGSREQNRAGEAANDARRSALHNIPERRVVLAPSGPARQSRVAAFVSALLVAVSESVLNGFCK